MKNFGINQVGILKCQGGYSVQPWRTLQNNHDTEIDKGLKKLLKKFAKAINKHGNKSSNQLSITLPTANPDGSSYNPRYSTTPTKATISSTGRTNAQEAAALSLASTSLNTLGPKGVIAGQILGIPDIIYDWAASIDEPENARNHFHTVSNHLETIADWTPMPWDDPIAKAIKKSGTVDDAFSSFGYDLTDFLTTNKKLKKDE